MPIFNVTLKLETTYSIVAKDEEDAREEAHDLFMEWANDSDYFPARGLFDARRANDTDDLDDIVYAARGQKDADGNPLPHSLEPSEPDDLATLETLI